MKQPLRRTRVISQFWIEVANGARPLPTPSAPAQFLDALAETSNVPEAMQATHTDHIAVLAWSRDSTFCADMNLLLGL